MTLLRTLLGAGTAARQPYPTPTAASLPASEPTPLLASRFALSLSPPQ